VIFCYWLRRLFALPAHPLSLSPSLPLLPPAAGKTLAFLLPVVEALFRQRWGKLDGLGALIISPTRELAMQVWGAGEGVRMHACMPGVCACRAEAACMPGMSVQACRFAHMQVIDGCWPAPCHHRALACRFLTSCARLASGTTSLPAC
jgi:hypothetical protein